MLAWLPRVDGIFFTDDPFTLVQEGKFARVPIVSGTGRAACVVAQMSNIPKESVMTRGRCLLFLLSISRM
jgi:hypothetical protein